MWTRRGSTSTAIPILPPDDAPSSDEDDLTVVLRAIIDRHAFSPLYEKYVTAIYRRCFGKLSDPDEAWDATSVTFHKALAALDGFRGGSFQGWLYRIADHACADVHRLRARMPVADRAPSDELPTDALGPEDQTIAEMDREHLEDALRRLPPRRERIVRLHLAGLKGKEIAARMGISHDVVRQQQRLALRQLADLLGVGDAEPGGRNG